MSNFVLHLSLSHLFYHCCIFTHCVSKTPLFQMWKDAKTFASAQLCFPDPNGHFFLCHPCLWHTHHCLRKSPKTTLSNWLFVVAKNSSQNTVWNFSTLFCQDQSFCFWKTVLKITLKNILLWHQLITKTVSCLVNQGHIPPYLLQPPSLCRGVECCAM